jgi:hypothetical protein
MRLSHGGRIVASWFDGRHATLVLNADSTRWASTDSELEHALNFALGECRLARDEARELAEDCLAHDLIPAGGAVTLIDDPPGGR